MGAGPRAVNRARPARPAPRGAASWAPVDAVSQVSSAVGEDALRGLVAAFYARVRGDDLLAPLYPAGDWAGAERRLADFLVFRCGGPPTYVEQRGHPRLRMRHAPFPVDRARRDRWVALMGAALDDRAAGWPDDAEATLRAFLAETATFLINRGDSPGLDLAP